MPFDIPLEDTRRPVKVTADLTAADHDLLEHLRTFMSQCSTAHILAVALYSLSQHPQYLAWAKDHPIERASPTPTEQRQTRANSARAHVAGK